MCVCALLLQTKQELGLPVGQARLKAEAFSQFGASCISLCIETNFKFT